MTFFRIIGIVPLGIGVTVLGFLWSQPFGGFGSPPLFFRIFGSFIALFLILQGGALLFMGVGNPSRMVSRMSRQLRDAQKEFQTGNENSEMAEPAGYRCSACGAPLADGADVSPHGDVKCGHCGKWFNVFA